VDEINNQSEQIDGKVSDSPSAPVNSTEHLQEEVNELTKKNAAAQPESTDDVLNGMVTEAFLPPDFVILPDVPISKDHTAQIKNDLEYEVVLEKCGGTLCTFFYSQSDKNGQTMKNEIVELARSLNGKATFAFVNSDEAKEFIDKANLSKKLPTFVIADYKKAYIHPYFIIADTKNLQSLIERYDRGERKLEQP
jgi:hypothetical protein